MEQATAGTLISEVGGAQRCCWWGSRGSRYPGSPTHESVTVCGYRGEQGGDHVRREQCSGLFCRLSASFWDPPFHAPWSNRHRHSTQKEEPPYLVLERKGKGYPRMPAALGHPPAVAGPHPRVQFRLPPAGGGTAQGLGRRPAGKQPAGSGAPGWGPARVGVDSCVCPWTVMRRGTLGRRGREGRKEPIPCL